MVVGTSTEALAAFDAARDAYVALMRRVPAADVGYLKPGDDYSVGGIAVHVNYVFDHYLGVLETMRAGGFGECRAQDPPGLEERARERAGMSLTKDEVDAELARTAELHDQVRGLLESLGPDVERKAPVFYGAAAEAFPTSGLDVLGWLSGHYEEHVPQVEALIAESESGSPEAVVTRFNEAFGRGDVDAVMALMTDDCVFENTFPAPDGERHAGQAAVRAFWDQFFNTTDRPRFETEEMFSAGDRVVVRWRFAWGEGAGGGHVRGVDIIRVRDGKVAEKFAYVKG